MGGVVHLRLTSGDYTIRAGTSDHIVMRWHADDPADANDMNKIKVRFSVSGNTAEIQEKQTRLSQ